MKGLMFYLVVLIIPLFLDGQNNPVYQLDEVTLNHNKELSFLDKIYAVYKENKYNTTNYHFVFKNINLETTDKVFVKINERFYDNQVNNLENRTIELVYKKMNIEWYKSKGMKHVKEGSFTRGIVYKNKEFSLPMYGLVYYHSSSTKLTEIHEFFKNKKKYKYTIVEDSANYKINYRYKNPHYKFKYIITLTVDKESLFITEFKKTLVPNKRNTISHILINTEVSQSYFVSKDSEEFLFVKNKSNDFVLDYHKAETNYEYFNKTSRVPFFYNYTLKPFDSKSIAPKNLVNFNNYLMPK